MMQGTRLNRRAEPSMPIDDADRKRIVQAIRTYIARERISREEFARRTRLGKATVDKLVVGIFSEKTIITWRSCGTAMLRYCWSRKLQPTRWCPRSSERSTFRARPCTCSFY